MSPREGHLVKKYNQLRITSVKGPPRIPILGTILGVAFYVVIVMMIFLLKKLGHFIPKGKGPYFTDYGSVHWAPDELRLLYPGYPKTAFDSGSTCETVVL